MSLSARPEFIAREVLGSQRLPDVRLEESRVPGNIAVFTRGDIEKSQARTLQELLSGEAGVNSFDSAGNSFQQTVDLRGFNAQPVPATAVVVDGVRVNENDMGQVNWQLLPVENIERVEIHPGPSTLYGKNALGGVIHITTKRGAKDFLAETGMGYGSHNRRKGWVQISDTLAGFDYLLSATKENDNGYRTNSDASVGTMLGKLGYRIDKRSDVSVAYTRADDRLQQPGSLTASEAAQDPTRNVSAVESISKLDMFTYNQRQALPWDFSAAFNGYLRNRREATPRNKSRSGSLSNFLADMKSQGLTGQLSRDSEVLGLRSVLTAGAEVSRNDARSEGAGVGWGSKTFARDESLGVFAQSVQDLIADKLILTAGVRYDQSKVRFECRGDYACAGYSASVDEGEQRFHRTNPRVGINVNFTEDAGGYALYSEAFRAPTVNEVSAIGPFTTSVLKPVKARNYEVGAKTALGDEAQLHAAAFLEDVQDDIYPVFDPVAMMGRNINIDKTRHTGVEWGLKARWEDRVEATLSHAYTRSTFQSEMTLDKVPWGNTQQVQKGDRLPMVPEHRVSAGLSVHPAQGWTASADGLCVGGQRILGDESNTEAPIPAYCTFGLGGSYERSGWRVFLKGSNILDRKYISRGIMSTSGGAAERFMVPGTGAAVFGGVSWRFTMGEERSSLALKDEDGARDRRKPEAF